MILIYKFNVDYKNNTKKIFIEALEQRIMLDGAGASTFLDIIDDRNQDKFLQKNSKKITKFSENKIDDQSQKLPFDQVTRDQKRNERKQVVFIDSQVQDYQTLINAFNEDTEVHLIQSNEDGFKKIDSVLKDNCDVSSLHIIGHGSAGKILFGNATLSNDTIQSYNQTLRSIGQCLTEDGDILFYGCNVASTDGGKALISKISEVTKADIAASDDVTGKGGDWDLEKKIGIVETENVTVVEYDYKLGTFVTASAATSAASVDVNADGITSIAGAISAYTGSDATSFDFRSDIESGGSVAPQDRWMVVKEKTGITSGTITGLLAPRTNGSGSVLSSSARTATSSDPFDVYSIHLNRDWNSKSYRYDRVGKVTFDNDIIGILKDVDETVDDTSATGIALHNTSATYPGSPHNDRNFEDFEIRTFNSGGYGTDNDHDFVAVSSDLNTIHVGGKNGAKGDYIRVIVAGDASNTDPVAVNDTDAVNEDATVTQSSGSGLLVADDTDADSDTLTVTAIKTGGEGLGGTTSVSAGSSYNSSGTSVTGTYGTLTLGADGTYTYTADQSAADDLDAGDTVTDVFTYTVSDGTATDTATLTITVTGINDAPVAVNDTDAVNEDATITQSSGSSLVMADDTDADDSASLTVTAIQPSGGSSSNVSSSSSYNSSGTTVTGTYGTLVIGADGTYTYTADQSAADDLDASDTVTDVFTYTVSDGTATDTATLTITVTGINDAPVAVNDTDAVNEDATITQSSGSSLVMADDTDADDSASITVTQIAVTGGSNSAVSGGSSYNSSGTTVTGTYGTLVIGADGTYTYTADQSAADDLDASDTVTDSFTYTISDGTATDTATLIITVTGVNDAPVAQNDVGYIKEGGTLSVSNGANANVSGSYDATGEHSGDVINTSSGTHSDSDADDSASLVVSAIRTGSTEGSGTAGTLGQSLSGTYGTLTMNANGSYTYVSTANSVSGTVTDVFNYTLSDGTATDTATLTITIYNSNDPVAANNTGVINEDATLSVSDGASANSITTAAASYSSSDAKSISDQETAPAGLIFSHDGTKMFHGGNDNDDIHEYTLSTAWDVSTASYVDAFSIASQDSENEPFGLTFNNDGTKMYVAGADNDVIYQYTLSTAYDVSTSTYANKSLDVSDETSRPCGIRFNNDGTKLFVTDFETDYINEYALSTAYDVSTASYSGDSERFSVGSQATKPRDVQFNLDGTKMFVVDGTGDDINEYTLSTGFDVSTAAFVDSFSVSSQDGNPFSMTFSNDGTKMFMMGYNSDKVHEYSLVSPYNLINVTGEHDGDVLGDDTDADSDTLTVASVRIGASEGNGSAGTVGSALTGTYGQLTLNSNGSYSYVANQSAADDLDAGDVVTDSFNYTVQDGNGGTDTATITITILLVINDTPVAVDDTDSVNANETTTAIDGSSNDVLTDDTDADDSASLTVTAIQPSGGSSSNVSSGSSYNSSGTEVTGTYGTLTIGADGSYTYVADQDAADNIDSGSSETDVFTYTVSDGTDTTTATLTITVSGTEDTTTTAIKETKKEKKEAKKQKKELKKERKELKKAKRLLLKEFKLAKSSINRSAEFNQGLKLVDLVAESGSIDFKQGEEDISKLNAKFTDKSLKVKFKVFNDEGKDVQKYYGTMKDGSPLPKWIQVDPKTGKTKTEIPKGVKMVEFKIIAIDVDNNIKQVTVIIDAKKLAKDKDVLKQTRKLLKEKTIEVKNDGTVKLNSIDKDGSIDKTITNTINDSQSIEDIIKTIEPDEFLNLQSELSDNEQVVDLSVSLDFLIQNEFKTSFEDIKIVLKDGQELPNWIKFDPNSGKIISNPPKDVSSVDLKIIVEDPNGEIIVKDLTINFSKENLSNFQKNLDNDTRFVSLSSQLSKEYSNWDNYGSQLIDRL